MAGYVIFDMDGVLVNSEPVHQEVEADIFRSLQLDIPASEHLTFMGMAPEDMWALVKERYGLQQSVPALVALEKEMKAASFGGMTLQPMPGVADFIRALKKEGYHLSVASSSPAGLIALITRSIGLADYFDVLVSAEEVRRGKPAPDVFLRVADWYSLPPASFVVVEDSTNGVAAAKAAGMRCIGYTGSAGQQLAAADITVSDFSALTPATVAALLGQR